MPSNSKAKEVPIGGFAQNIAAYIVGSKLRLEIDLNEKVGPSKSGKSDLIATCRGSTAVTVDGREVRFGLNVYEAH